MSVADPFAWQRETDPAKLIAVSIRHHTPGSVRESANIVVRACLIAQVLPSDLKAAIERWEKE